MTIGSASGRVLRLRDRPSSGLAPAPARGLGLHPVVASPHVYGHLEAPPQHDALRWAICPAQLAPEQPRAEQAPPWRGGKLPRKVSSVEARQLTVEAAEVAKDRSWVEPELDLHDSNV